MKKLNLLLAFLIGFILFNCSSDDNSNTQEEPQNSQIVRTIQRIYDLDNSSLLEERIVIDYNNGKPILWSFYDNTNQLTFTEELNYSNNGLLTSIQGFLSDGTSYSETSITYDSSNRILQRIYNEEDGSYNETISFIYNNNNTITSETNSNGFTSSKIFELNDDGIIYREIQNGNIVVSVNYNNFNPISKTSFSTTYTYEYLNSGNLPSFSSIFGSNPANVVLFGNSLANQSDSLTTELISKITSDTSTQEFIYILNDNNYPISMQNFSNGNLRNEYEYIYE